MSNKHSRHTPSPSTPPPHSKLPKFLQKPASRDRSRSVNDGTVSSPELSTTPAASSKYTRRSKFLGGDKSVPEEPSLESEETPVIIEPPPTTPVSIPRSRTRPERPNNSEPPTSPTYPSTSPSSRIGDLPTRLSGWFSHTFSTSSTDLSLPSLISNPSHAVSNSTSTGSATSPKPNRLTGASALLTAAKHGKGHLDKAMRYLLDSDATPDKCTDPIWILGVQHPGYEPSQTSPPSSYPAQGGTIGRRGSVTHDSSSPSSFRSSSSDHSPGHTRSRSRGHGHSSSISQSAPNSNFLSQSQPASSRTTTSSSSSSTAQPSLYNPNISGSSTTSLSSKDPKHPGANWPPVFYSDFTSRIWLTYRSHFTPIRDCRLGDLSPPACEPIQQVPSSPRSGRTGTSIHSTRYTDSYKSDSSSTNMSHSSRGGPGSPNSTLSSNTKRWNWPGLGGEKGWTSDSGWGCMLRTGQSLLANSLLFLHLGRDWRRPPYPEMTKEYATYVQIVTWFLDTPLPEAPFSVHRMALAGKELGKDVGMWFGPSTAAGAIRTLVHAFPESGLGVAIAADGGALYQTEVYAASHGSSTVYPGGKRGKGGPASWGHRPVLLLFGIRLGIDGVNPIYYETIKLLYTFPQSVGIAGGRPSSSYYFVGSQADNLFYLDPHHARPAVPLRSPSTSGVASSGPMSDAPVKERDKDEKEKKKKVKEKKQQRSSSGSSVASGGSNHASTSPTRTSSSFHTPISPSPLQKQYSSNSNTSASGTSGSRISTNSGIERSGSYGSTSVSSQSPSRTDSPVSISRNVGDMDYSELVGIEDPVQSLDPLQVHYATAYSAAELKTFHCERVRKMPLSGLDPSMLIGFLVRDENDWVDLRKRVAQLPRTIFSIQDEPPKWAADSDDNIDLESMSDEEGGLDMPEDDLEDVEPSVEESGEGGDDDEDSEKYYDSRSRSASDSPSSGDMRRREGGGIRSGSGKRKERGKSEEVDTEEDPVDPITPGPTATRFDLSMPDPDAEADKPFNEDDIEDDWVDPSVSSPLHTPPSSQFQSSSVPAVVPMTKTKSNGSTTGSVKKKKKKEKQVPVPVPKVTLPTHPVQESFPFPMAKEEPPEISHSHSYSSSSSSGAMADHEESLSRGYEGRMHTARARDGGRTQSGGVKGILTDDWVETERT